MNPTSFLRFASRLLAPVLFGCLLAPAFAQSPGSPQRGSTPVLSTNPTVREQLRQFDAYLNANPRMEQLLDQNLNRLNEQSFLEHNPEWADELQSQPGLADAIRAERNFLLHRILERRAHVPVLSADLDAFDRFLQQHPEINGPVQENPELLSDAQFLRAHPPLARFYDEHAALSTVLLQVGGGSARPVSKRVQVR